MAQVETVYGTVEEGHVMSEKVSSLAATIYKEFERMMKKYDEDVVKGLMPLIVGILEGLDNAYSEKQETDVECELLRDDNEQLLTQYEREKQLRKAAEQKYLEMEDAVMGEKKDLQDKVESLESIVRMLELKSKNAADHVSRLEEKENEMKKEYNKLHERYTELFKTHMDYMERTKILMGTDKLSEMSANSPRIKGGFQLPSLRPVSMFVQGSGETPAKSDGSPMSFDLTSPQSGRDSNVSIKSELSDLDSPEPGKMTHDKEQVTDNISVAERSTTTGTKKPSTPTSLTPDSTEEVVQLRKKSDSRDNSSAKDLEIRAEISDQDNSVSQQQPPPPSENRGVVRLISEDAFEDDTLPLSTGLGETLQSIVASTPELDDESLSSQGSGKRASRRNDRTIFDELACQGADIAEVDFGADITGREVNPAEYASSDSDDDGDKENDKDSVVSDNFFGMGKELENLILENTELLATKNALNIVKDDLIAKVDELSSEQEILREEITSLQAVKGRLQLRITQLEEELKKTKEEMQKKVQAATGDEEDVPMAQRKRFTRVEMARVLMERNQYKERLMELQEAVRWTEMIRASREHPEAGLQPKKKSSIWNFFSSIVSSDSSSPPSPEKKKNNVKTKEESARFSNLFNSPNKPKRSATLPVATVKYNAPTTQVQPVGDPNKKQREKYNLGQKSKAYEFLQDDAAAEKTRKEREKERREQYKQVRAHVKKDDGRMQAYGWSLPAKFTPQIPREQSSKSHVPVPVPVYCRPLLEKEPGLKIWCAAGVNLTGGKTRDGGSIVGASVFYSNPPEETDTRRETKDEVEKLNQELKDHEKNLKSTDTEQFSSLVWICTSTHSTSRVSVIDSNNPGDILDSFRVSSTHMLCISSVPGALESDYPVAEEILKAEAPPLPKETVVSEGSNSTDQNGDNSGVGGITFVQCSTGTTGQEASSETSPAGSPAQRRSRELSPETDAEVASALAEAVTDDGDSGEVREKAYDEINKDGRDEDPLGATTLETIKPTVFRATGSPVSSGTATPNSTSSGGEKRLQDQADIEKDANSTISDNELQYGELEKMSSVLPTMWMGSQSGSLYVHSAVAQWRRCLHSVKLRDSILSIVHVKGRVLVALADGTVAIFHRAADGQWDLKNYHLLDLGRPHHSIRCMTPIANKNVWCGYKNKIHIINPQTMAIEKSFDAHPRKESQVRQLCWVGDGVWVSIRLDSTLRLYHAHTHQHLQDVDIEPYVSKMLGTGKLGFSFVRITAMLISCNRLWIGTGNGVIISVPLSESNKQQVTTSSRRQPGGVIRVYSDTKTDSVTPGSFIPYCSMAQAQLSFHGHKDAVKFFVAVPGSPRKGMSAAATPVEDEDALSKSQLEAVPAPPTNTKLVLSGGEGYVDFRIGDGDDDELVIESEEEKKTQLNKVDRSHLIVWQVTQE